MNVVADATAAAVRAGIEARLPKVRGAPLDRLPEDLYIPPDALEVFLEAFEGPLDLLLYLIRRRSFDILDIPILAVTRQYMQYIELMRELRLELAAEYLVMAALLAEIKSRVLLPRPPPEEGLEQDPRMTLVRRLQEYERFKTAAENLDGLPRTGREIFVARAKPEKVDVAVPLPVPALRELVEAYRDAMRRSQLFGAHPVQRELLSVRARMSQVLSRLSGRGPLLFSELVDPAEGRPGVVVCFLAVLELVKRSMIELRQDRAFSPVRLGLPRVHEAETPPPTPA